MAYSKAKLKSNGIKTSLCLKPFLTGNMLDKCLPTQTLLQVSFRYNFISLTSFMRIPNSMRMLFKTLLLTVLQAFLKSIKSQCTVLLYYPFFSSMWWMQNIGSVV